MKLRFDRLKEAASHPSFHRYASNTYWLLAEKVWRITVGLLVTACLARNLGPQAFGTLNYAQSFAVLFIALSTLGLDGIAVRELVRKKEHKEVILGTCFALKIGGSIISFVLLCGTILLSHVDLNSGTLVLIIACSAFFQAFNVIDFFFQSTVLSKYTVIAQAIGMTLASVLKVVLVIINASLIYLAATFVIESLLIAATLVYCYHRTGEKLVNWSFSKHIATELLGDSWPLLMSGIMVTIYMKIDQIMIKSILGSEAVGQYAAATRISEMVYFLPVVISGSLFPALLNAKEREPRAYVARLRRLYSLMIWLGIASALILTVSGDWVISIIYGNQYYESAHVLKIHTWSSIFVFLTVASGKWLIAENYTSLALARNSLGAISNVALNYILIPRYGIASAAYSTLFSWLLSGLLFDIFPKRTRQMFFIKLQSFNPMHLWISK